MLRIGIECESIEQETWGVGRIVLKLLEEIAKRPELQKEFRFFLYFKSRVPALPYLSNPIFIKKVIGARSFSLYYYLLLPTRLWFEGLDMMFFPNYMLPILFRGKSLVMLTDDIYYEINSGTLPFRYKLAYKIFTGWAAMHATKITTISEASAKEVIRLFKILPKRITVNQLGVDPPKPITYNSSSSSSLRLSESNDLKLSELNGLKPETYILYVGQTFPRRHLRETILAFEKISTRFPDLKLVAIGKDKYNPPIIENFKNEINKKLGRERIIYKEYVSENRLREFYTQAKLLIYVSSKEAFGLPPLEALSYGVPSVVAEQEVTREIFGSHAFFAYPELVEGSEIFTPDSIAATIVDGLTNEQKRCEIIKSAPEILSKYTWQKYTDRFLEIIRP